MAIQEIICALFKLGASCYSMPIDELLIEYLLVPSVILIIILYVAVNMFLAGTALKIKGLLAIVFYIIIVYQGWYGIIAQFTMAFLPLWLLGIIALFFVGKIFKKKWATEGPSRLAKTISDWQKLKETVKTGRKKEDMKELETKLSEYASTHQSVLQDEDALNNRQIPQNMISFTQMEIRDNKNKMAQLKADIIRLEKKLKLTQNEKQQYKQQYGQYQGQTVQKDLIDFW